MAARPPAAKLHSHEDRACEPGQLAPISGIYHVVHDGHRQDHEVVAIRGEEFPLCRICQGNVQFHIAKVASHMTHDRDLAGSVFMIKAKRRAASKRTG